MIFPTIHNNGSDPEKLIEQYSAAATACREALDLLEACSPHSRDYYIQSTEAMVTASAEHMARIQKLIAIKAELSMLAENVQKQVDAREEQRKLHRASRTS
jgi:hypothetical protein